MCQSLSLTKCLSFFLLIHIIGISGNKKYPCLEKGKSYKCNDGRNIVTRKNMTGAENKTKGSLPKKKLQNL